MHEWSETTLQIAQWFPRIPTSGKGLSASVSMAARPQRAPS